MGWPFSATPLRLHSCMLSMLCWTWCVIFSHKSVIQQRMGAAAFASSCAGNFESVITVSVVHHPQQIRLLRFCFVKEGVCKLICWETAAVYGLFMA